MDETGGWTSSAEAWIALQGEEGDASRREVLDPALEPILGNVAGKEIIDVGCGEGRYCRILASKGAKVTGIDPTPSFIELAKQRHSEGAYLEGRAEDLPFSDSSFDVVVSYVALVDIPDDLAAIREMARVCRQGGQVVVATISNLASTSAEWVKDGGGRRLYRTVDRYMECFSMWVAWKGIEIENYHRPLSRTLQAHLDAGLELTHFLEPLPAPDSPYYADEFRVPTFQVMAFRKS